MAYAGIISGVRTSQNINTANQRPDILKVLALLEPYQTPFLQFLFFSNKPSIPVQNKQGTFSWFEDEYFPHQTTTTAAITAAGSPKTLGLTTSNCANVSIFNLNDLVYIEETDETAFVSAVSAGVSATLTAVDGVSDLTSTASTTGYLKKFGSLNSENNSTPTAMSTKEIQKTNYLNILLESVANTGRDQAGLAYTDGTTHAEQVQKKMKEMKVQAERLFIYSKLAGTKVSGGVLTTYGQGLLGRLSTNVTSYTGTPTETGVDTFISNVAAKGTGKKIFLMGSTLHNNFQQIIKAKLGAIPNSYVTSYGVRVTEYMHGQALVKVTWDPMLDGKFTNSGFLIDEGYIKARHMANDLKGSRKFRIEPNVETPGTDRKETKLLADIGVQIENEEVHGYFYKA